MQQSVLVRRAVIAVFAMLSLTTALPAQDAVAKEIMKLEDQWAIATITKSGATIGKMLAEDFTFVSPMGVLSGKAQAIAEANKDTTHYSAGANGDYKVRIYGNTVVITGVFRVTKQNAKKNMKESYRWTDTWIKQADGRWLCVATQSAQMK